MITIPEQLESILDRAWEGKAPTREEMTYLLKFPEGSYEAFLTRNVANQITRRRANNKAFLCAQIGYSTSPCSGDCLFCGFAASHTSFPKTELSMDEIIRRSQDLTRDGMLDNLWLMAMHRFDFGHFLDIVSQVRKVIPEHVILSSNVGDLTKSQVDELKAAGLKGAYHSLRLREGIDTKLDPKKRIETIQYIQEAGLQWGFCCEPIGPEHTPEELTDHMIWGMSRNPHTFSVMRRINLPNGPLSHRGQISLLRLAQIVGAAVLLTVPSKEILSVGGHEPNLLCLTSGANNACAESGANPRDDAIETTKNIGLTTSGCLQLFREAGFDGVLRGDHVPVMFQNLKQ